MNDTILTIFIYLFIIGLPIWFCIELIGLLKEKYPSLNSKNWSNFK